MTARRGLVLGLLDTAATIPSRALADRCRDLTICWSRYAYHGPMLEDPCVDRLLSRAADDGYRHCLVQAYGHILREQWLPDEAKAVDQAAALESQAGGSFLVAGRIRARAGGWYGLERSALLVDLECYEALGRPSFAASPGDDGRLPGSKTTPDGDRIERLSPGADGSGERPSLPGWRLLARSLEAGLAVPSIESVLGHGLLHLDPGDAACASVLERYLGERIRDYPAGDAAGAPNPALATFLSDVATQVLGAPHGVFLVNIEPHDDVAEAPAAHRGPVSTLYCVAAGFKPNRILLSHGMSRDTRVVHFDYSHNALAVRRWQIEQWDGRDFPGFVRQVFDRYPAPETFYQLWAGHTPATLPFDELDAHWRRELEGFGGADAFADHWRRYRSLAHEFVDCDLLMAPEPLLARMRREPGSVMWFSNAPFTVHGNWHYPLAQRRERYEHWIGALAGRNPDLLLYGADYTNTSVNHVTAGEYLDAMRGATHDELRPLRLHRMQIPS